MITLPARPSPSLLPSRAKALAFAAMLAAATAAAQGPAASSAKAPVADKASSAEARLAEELRRPFVSVDGQAQTRAMAEVALRERLAEAAVTAQPLAGFPEALGLEGHPGDLRQLPGYTEGWWCVQDRQAQQVVPLLAPQPGERILDACAAPGGKSIQIAERQNDTGEIWAVDRSEGRLQRLVHSAQRLGLGSIHTLAGDALSLAAARPDWTRGRPAEWNRHRCTSSRRLRPSHV